MSSDLKGNQLDVFFVCCTVSLADYCDYDPQRHSFVSAFLHILDQFFLMHQSDLNYLSWRDLAHTVCLPCVWLCAQS